MHTWEECEHHCHPAHYIGPGESPAAIAFTVVVHCHSCVDSHGQQHKEACREDKTMRFNWWRSSPHQRGLACVCGWGAYRRWRRGCRLQMSCQTRQRRSSGWRPWRRSQCRWNKPVGIESWRPGWRPSTLWVRGDKEKCETWETRLSSTNQRIQNQVFFLFYTPSSFIV